MSMRYLKKLTFYLLPVLSLASEICLAQSSDDEDALLELYGDEEMISIATGQKQSIAKAPAVASVITADDILRSGATDIDDVLEMVPGLHVSRHPFGYSPLYVFRGIYSEYNPQVLMLINGVPITNLFHGNRGLIWGGLPINNISRIEVIRGPGSAIYGAEAFAGVINVITKPPSEIDGTETGIRTGSFGRRDAWLLHGNSWNKFDIAFSLQYHDTNGSREKIHSDAQTKNDAMFDTTASLAPGAVNLQRKNIDTRLDIAYEKLRFRAGLQQRADWGNGVGIGEALDPNNYYLSNRWNVDLSYHNENFMDNWNVTGQLSYLKTSQEVEKNLIIYPPGVKLQDGGEEAIYPEGLIGNPEVFEQHSRVDASAFYSGLKRNSIRLGAGYYYGDLYKVQESKNFGIDPATGNILPPGANLVDVTDTPYVFLREGSRKNYYAFAQDVWEFSTDWELTAGVRYDHYSDFGSTINPRLAIVWSTLRTLTTKFLYGEAFRSPSFVETRAINNPSVLGNANLNPETMKSYEIAFNYQPNEKLQTNLNLFYYSWNDIIEFVPDTGKSTSTAQNNGKQTGRGLEVELKWEISSHLYLNSNFSLQRSINENFDHAAIHAPSKQFSASLDWDFLYNWHLNAEIHYILDRKRFRSDPRSDIDDYRLVNMNLRRKSSDGKWEVALSAKNIFNNDVREPSPWSDPTANIPEDLPQAKRNFFIQYQYHFD